MKKNKNKNNKNKKKRAPDPPGYLRPNSFVPRVPKGTHAGEGSLASEKVSLPTLFLSRQNKPFFPGELLNLKMRLGWNICSKGRKSGEAGGE